MAGERLLLAALSVIGILLAARYETFPGDEAVSAAVT
jgi:hypothetical protein